MAFYDADVFNKGLRYSAHAIAVHSSDNAIVCYSVEGLGRRTITSASTCRRTRLCSPPAAVLKLRVPSRTSTS